MNRLYKSRLALGVCVPQTTSNNLATKSLTKLQEQEQEVEQALPVVLALSSLWSNHLYFSSFLALGSSLSVVLALSLKVNLEKQNRETKMIPTPKVTGTQLDRTFS